MQCQRVAAGIVLAAGLGLAQVEPAPPEGAFRISADVERVVLPVTVVDHRDRVVPDLTKDCFRIYDQGRSQAVHDFFYRDIPLTVGLVMDSSTSMMPKRATAILAALSFVRLSNPEDQTFVVNFNEKASFGLPEAFSADPSRLGEAFLKLPCLGQTALYDAVLAATEHLSGGTRDKKALIVVSDGGDNVSRHRLRETMEALQRSEAIVYTIGLYDPDDPDRNPGVLKQLARPTGGEAFFPDSPQRSARHPGACRQGSAQPVHHHLRALRRGPRWPLSPHPGNRERTGRAAAGCADARRVLRSRARSRLHGSEPVKAPMRAAEMVLWSAAAVLLGIYACVYLERNVYQAYQSLVLRPGAPTDAGTPGGARRCSRARETAPRRADRTHRDSAHRCASHDCRTAPPIPPCAARSATSKARRCLVAGATSGWPRTATPSSAGCATSAGATGSRSILSRDPMSTSWTLPGSSARTTPRSSTPPVAPPSRWSPATRSTTSGPRRGDSSSRHIVRRRLQTAAASRLLSFADSVVRLSRSIRAACFLFPPVRSSA